MIKNKYIIIMLFTHKFIIENNTNLLINAINNNDESIINKFVDEIISGYVRFNFMEPIYSVCENIFDKKKLILYSEDNKFKKLFLYFSDEYEFNKIIKESFNELIIILLEIIEFGHEKFFINKYDYVKKFIYNKLNNCKRYSKYLLLYYAFDRAEYHDFRYNHIINNKYDKISKIYAKKLKYCDLPFEYRNILSDNKQKYFDKKKYYENPYIKRIKTSIYVSKLLKFDILYYILKK